MGTRLYPNTQDPRVLERLAGVSKARTKSWRRSEKYAELIATRPRTALPLKNSWSGVDLQSKSLTRSAHSNTDAYHNFVTFGWGRIPISGSLIVLRSCVGNETQPDKVEAILKLHQASDLNVSPCRIAA